MCASCESLPANDSRTDRTEVQQHCLNDIVRIKLPCMQTLRYFKVFTIDIPYIFSIYIANEFSIGLRPSAPDPQPFCLKPMLYGFGHRMIITRNNFMCIRDVQVHLDSS